MSEARFWAKVDKTGECWIWKGSISSNGYGKIHTGGRFLGVHRVAFELAVGPIPDGMVIDHVCHVPICVKPDHLRLATTKENQENLAGAKRSSRTGIRGVGWSVKNNAWQARVTHNGELIHLGYFATAQEAEAVVVTKRLELFTHNDMDRIAS